MSDQPIDTLKQKADGTARHPSIAGVLRHFRFAHLPPHLQAVSKPCAELAVQMADTLPENPDLTCGLRDLLTAKDNFVRALLPILLVCFAALVGCAKASADEYDDLGCYVGGKSREDWYAAKRAAEMRAMYAPVNSPVQILREKPAYVAPKESPFRPGDIVRHRDPWNRPERVGKVEWDSNVNGSGRGDWRITAVDGGWGHAQAYRAVSVDELSVDDYMRIKSTDELYNLKKGVSEKPRRRKKGR